MERLCTTPDTTARIVDALTEIETSHNRDTTRKSTSLVYYSKKPVYPDAGYPDRIAPSIKFLENSIKELVLKLAVLGSSAVQCFGLQNFKSGVVERFKLRYIL